MHSQGYEMPDESTHQVQNWLPVHLLEALSPNELNRCFKSTILSAFFESRSHTIVADKEFLLMHLIEIKRKLFEKWNFF